MAFTAVGAKLSLTNNNTSAKHHVASGTDMVRLNGHQNRILNNSSTACTIVTCCTQQNRSTWSVPNFNMRLERPLWRCQLVLCRRIYFHFWTKNAQFVWERVDSVEIRVWITLHFIHYLILTNPYCNNQYKHENVSRLCFLAEGYCCNR